MCANIWFRLYRSLFRHVDIHMFTRLRVHHTCMLACMPCIHTYIRIIYLQKPRRKAGAFMQCMYSYVCSDRTCLVQTGSVIWEVWSRNEAPVSLQRTDSKSLNSVDCVNEANPNRHSWKPERLITLHPNPRLNSFSVPKLRSMAAAIPCGYAILL